MQVVMDMNLGVPDEGPAQDAMLQRLAEKEPQYWGHQLSAAMTPPKSVAAGPVRDLRFLDTQTCFWQLALGQSLQHGATTSQGIPHLGEQIPPPLSRRVKNDVVIMRHALCVMCVCVARSRACVCVCVCVCVCGMLVLLILLEEVRAGGSKALGNQRQDGMYIKNS